MPNSGVPMPITPPPNGAATTTPKPRRWLMTRRETAVVLGLAALLLMAIVGLMIRDRHLGPPVTEVINNGDIQPYRVNINAATADELRLLPGVGPSKADEIVKYRQVHGPFASVADLAHVPRIGTKLAASVAPYVTAE